MRMSYHQCRTDNVKLFRLLKGIKIVREATTILLEDSYFVYIFTIKLDLIILISLL